MILQPLYFKEEFYTVLSIDVLFHYGSQGEEMKEVADGSFYEEHETEIQIGVTIAGVIAVTAGAVIAAPVSVPTALGFIGATTFGGGVLGGWANVMTGGSFPNGFIGGAVNGWITSVGACFGMGGYTDFAGGFVGNYITESLNDKDITDPNQPKKGQANIMLTSVGMGFTQVGLGKIKTLTTLKGGAGLAKGSEGYWIARFFGKNLEFTSSLGAYTLIDGLVRKFQVGENISILLCA